MWFAEQLATPAGARIRDYLEKERGLTPATIAALKLGWAPPGRDGLRQRLVQQGFAEALIRQSGLVSVRDDGTVVAVNQQSDSVTLIDLKEYPLPLFDQDEEAGSIIIDTESRKLYYVLGNNRAIRYGVGGWTNVESIHLFEEETFPVCSSRMAAEFPELSEMENIPRHRLLHLSGAAHQREDWRHLLELAGVKYSGDLGGLWLSNYGNVVQAARDSHGIAIAWRHVVERHLQSGELVNPTGRVFRTGRGFYLLRSQSRPLSPAAFKLHEWLLQEFSEADSQTRSARTLVDTVS